MIWTDQYAGNRKVDGIPKDTHRPVDAPSQHQTEQQILEGVTSAALQSYSLGRPNADHLLCLTRVNTYRAFVNNIQLLGLSMNGLCASDIPSPFTQCGPAQFPSKALIPSSLLPTPTQHRLPHHPWLDFFPIPRSAITLSGHRTATMRMNSVLIYWASGTQMQLIIC